MAVALHFLLDCVDREMPYFGTERAREEPEKILQYCVKKLEEKWKTQMYRYFYFNVNEIETYIEDMVERVKFLVRNYKGILEKRVGEIANEKEMKAILGGDERKLESIQEGYGSLIQMLTQLCRRRNIKCVFYVNYKPLPVATAAKKAQHLLEKGEEVTIMTPDRSIVITAKSLKELQG
jgi:hypothetical protein